MFMKYILALAYLLVASARVSAASILPAFAEPAGVPVEEVTGTPYATTLLAAAQPARTTAVAVEAPRATPPAAPARSSANNSPYYVGAQLGDSSIGVLVGYQINKMFAMEFSYDYADPKYTPTTVSETSRISASGLALFPIKFSEMGPMAIFVKAGYARTTDKFTVNDPGLGPGFPATSTVTTTVKTGVIGGAGVHVDLSAHTSARLGFHVVGSDRSVYMAAMYRF